MKTLRLILFFLAVIGFILVGCSKNPTEVTDNEESITNKTGNVLSKKGGGKPQTPNYTVTVTTAPDPAGFIVDHNLEYPYIEYNYSEQPYLVEPELGPTQFTKFNISAETDGDRKSTFYSIRLYVYPDLEAPWGEPDGEGKTILYRSGVTDNVYSLETDFYWWGQTQNDPDNADYNIRMITPNECGQYLAIVVLRRIIVKNKKGTMTDGVYSSTEDPNFQEYDGITKGYIPIQVNSLQ